MDRYLLEILFFFVGLAVAAIVTIDIVGAIEEEMEGTKEPENTPEDGVDVDLPNQGDVSEIPDAPPVDAGKQGKHVKGHANNKPDKSQWKPGENGVKQTQEAWKNGKTDPSGRTRGSVRIGQSGDGRKIRVHMDGKGRIHGYPIFPK